MVDPIEGARNANLDVDYPSIKQKGYRVKEAARDGFKAAANKLESIDTGEKTTEKLGFIRINDHTMKPMLDDAADIIKGLKNSVYDPINQLVDHAEQVHDELQRKYNEEAKAAKENNGVAA